MAAQINVHKQHSSNRAAERRFFSWWRVSPTASMYVCKCMLMRWLHRLYIPDIYHVTAQVWCGLSCAGFLTDFFYVQNRQFILQSTLDLPLRMDFETAPPTLSLLNLPSGGTKDERRALRVGGVPWKRKMCRRKGDGCDLLNFFDG